MAIAWIDDAPKHAYRSKEELTSAARIYADWLSDTIPLVQTSVQFY